MSGIGEANDEEVSDAIEEVDSGDESFLTLIGLR